MCIETRKRGKLSSYFRRHGTWNQHLFFNPISRKSRNIFPIFNKIFMKSYILDGHGVGLSPKSQSLKLAISRYKVYKCLRRKTERLIIWLYNGISTLLLFMYVYRWSPFLQSKVSVLVRVFLISTASVSTCYHRGRWSLGIWLPRCWKSGDVMMSPLRLRNTRSQKRKLEFWRENIPAFLKIWKNDVRPSCAKNFREKPILKALNWGS